MFLQHFPGNRATSVGVRGTTIGVVPGTRSAVGQLRFRHVPAAEFDQRIHPLVQMPATDVRPHVADLLLPCAPDFLHVVELFFYRPACSHRFQNLANFHRCFGAEVLPSPSLCPSLTSVLQVLGRGFRALFAEKTSRKLTGASCRYPFYQPQVRRRFRAWVVLVGRRRHLHLLLGAGGRDRFRPLRRRGLLLPSEFREPCRENQSPDDSLKGLRCGNE